MSTQLDVIIAGLIGFAIGAILVAIINRGSKSKSVQAEEETQKLQTEYDKYREQVNAHFAKTADAIDGLTKSYQQVFDHLSDGAQNLMDKKALQAQLEQRQGKAVTLAYLVEQEGSEGEKIKESVSKIKAASVVDNAKADTGSKVESKTETPATVTTAAGADKSAAGKTGENSRPEAKGGDNNKADIKPGDISSAVTPVKDARKETAPDQKVAAVNNASGTVVAPLAAEKTTGAPTTTKTDAEKPAGVAAAVNTTVNKTAGAASRDDSTAGKVEKSNTAKVTTVGSGTEAGKPADKPDVKNPAESIVKSNEHETAIEAVKKHIKDDKDSKA